MLTLVFQAPDDSIRRPSASRFVLYEQGDRYTLPDVVLRAEAGISQVDLHEVRIQKVTLPPHPDGSPNPAPPHLDTAIRFAWTQGVATGQDWVQGQKVVSAGATLHADALEPAGHPQQPVELVVTWGYAYTGPGKTPAGRQETVHLEFAPPGVQPPPETGPVTSQHDNAVPEAIRTRTPGVTGFPNFAAIDFGTSASTVTVYDARQVANRVLDGGQGRRLRIELADLLEQRPLGALGNAWVQHLDKLTARLAKDPAIPAGMAIADVASRLKTGPQLPAGQKRDAFLDAVCAALELEPPAALLRAWYVPRLLSCYHRAFSVPPMEELNLTPVIFNSRDPRPREISSDVQVNELSPLSVQLGRFGSGHSVWHDVKGRLLDRREIPNSTTGIDNDRVATTDDLIAHAYRELIEKTEEFLETDDQLGRRERQELEHVVVTYPTTTPPEARHRIHQMLRDTLGVVQVGLRYDEGIAAALYFLMRDFGGTQAEFGAEALRANSHRIDTEPGSLAKVPTWQQHIMVIDIGAGTTDIALVRLTLADHTSSDLRDDPVAGRYYVLTPEIVNSTGHPQLGGNVLTLRVFHWIKAMIVDALVTDLTTDSAHTDTTAERGKLRRQALVALGQDPTSTEFPNLAAQVVANADVTRTVPIEVLKVTRSLLPTHDKVPEGSDDPCTAAFWTLWEIAEQVKLKLAAEPPEGATVDPVYLLDRDAISDVLQAIDAHQGLERAKLLPETVPLRREDFLTLLRPVLAKAVGQASWLVRPLTQQPGDARLNRIMFSGKTTMMPLLHQLVREELTGVSASELPPALTIETEYAKEAASIGAAWAQCEFELRGGQRDELQVAKGRTVVSISVDNFSHTLPCGFTLLRANQVQESLLEAGRPVTEIATNGTLGARVEHTEQPWPSLTPTFEVLRPIDEVDAINWGTFNFAAHAAREDFTPTATVWYADPSAGRDSRISAQLELDQTLSPYLHICNGPPHYHVVEGDTLRISDVLDAEAWDHDGQLRALPDDIWVTGEPTPQYPAGEMLLFPAWLPDADEGYDRYFPEFFHESEGLESLPIPGRLSHALLPAALPEGDYEFYLGLGTGRRRIGSVQVMSRHPRTSRHIVTLDITGRLNVHRGNPPYWRAHGLRDVEEYPGAVLRVAMQRGPSHLSAHLDPFNGRH